MNLTDLEGLPKEQTGVYTITHKESKKKYIGSTNDCFRRRIFNHRARLRNDDHYNPHLQNAYNKYGEGAFDVEIVHKIAGYDAIVAMEQEMIQKYHDDWQNLYNSEKDARRTEPWNKGRENIYSQETLYKMSKAAKNRSNQDYVKKKHREAKRENANSIYMEYTDGEEVGVFENVYEIHELSKNGEFDLKENLLYNSLEATSQELKPPSIHGVCNGNKDSYKGFNFEYIEQQNG